MSRYVFPYGIRFQEDGNIETLPVAELVVKGRGDEDLHAVFHIDSGATISVLPAADAALLNIPLRAGEKIMVRGVSGKALKGFRHIISFQFGAVWQEVPVVFIDERILVPRILGRAGVFPRFGIIFDETKQRAALLEERSERSVIDSLF